MPRALTEIAFTPAVRAAQAARGSRAAYASFDEAADRRDTLGETERAFIAECDTFFQATVGETGWPYVQHRGGPRGFLRVVDASTLAYADYRGNRQYISVGNVLGDDRVSLILVDFAEGRRLKIWGHARIVEARDDPQLVRSLATEGYAAVPERAFVITVRALDWNCPQHIVPRFTLAQVEEMVEPLRAAARRLEVENERLRAAGAV